jgi:hypothetical protein
MTQYSKGLKRGGSSFAGLVGHPVSLVSVSNQILNEFQQFRYSAG